MALYRVLKPLSRNEKRIEAGQITALNWLTEEQTAVLVERRAVSRLATPPLVELPGWQRRGKRLDKLGIVTAEDFLEAVDREVASEMRVRPQTVGKWKREILLWLVIPPERGG